MLLLLVAFFFCFGFSENVSFVVEQVGPCNATSPPIECSSTGQAQTSSLSFANGRIVYENKAVGNESVVLMAQIPVVGNEHGVVYLSNEKTSFITYEALLDSHVIDGLHWAGFMAGKITGGGGAYSNIQGIMTFSALQIDPKYCNGAALCYKKFLAVQGFVPNQQKKIKKSAK